MDRLLGALGVTTLEARALADGTISARSHPAGPSIRHGYEQTDLPPVAVRAPVLGYDLGLLLRAQADNAPVPTADRLPLYAAPPEAPALAVHRDSFGRWSWHTTGPGLAPTGGTGPDEVLEAVLRQPEAVLLVASLDTLDALEELTASALVDGRRSAVLARWRASASTPGFRSAHPVLDLLAQAYQAPTQVADVAQWAAWLDVAGGSPAAMLAGLDARLVRLALEAPDVPVTDSLIAAEARTMPAAVTGLRVSDRLGGRRHAWTGLAPAGQLDCPARATRGTLSGLVACGYPPGTRLVLDDGTVVTTTRTDLEPDGTFTLAFTVKEPQPTAGSSSGRLAPKARTLADATAAAQKLAAAAEAEVRPLRVRATPEVGWDVLLDVADTDAHTPASAAATVVWHLASKARSVRVVGEPGSGKSTTVAAVASQAAEGTRVGVCAPSRSAAITLANRVACMGRSVRLVAFHSEQVGHRHKGGYVRRPHGLDPGVSCTQQGWADEGQVSVATDAQWLQNATAVRLRMRVHTSIVDVLVVDDADLYTQDELDVLCQVAPQTVLVGSTPDPARGRLNVLLAAATGEPEPMVANAPTWAAVPSAVAEVLASHPGDDALVWCPTEGMAAAVRAVLPERPGSRTVVVGAGEPTPAGNTLAVVVDPVSDPACDLASPHWPEEVRRALLLAPQRARVVTAPAVPAVP